MLTHLEILNTNTQQYSVNISTNTQQHSVHILTANTQNMLTPPQNTQQTSPPQTTAHTHTHTHYTHNTHTHTTHRRTSISRMSPLINWRSMDSNHCTRSWSQRENSYQRGAMSVRVSRFTSTSCCRPAHRACHREQAHHVSIEIYLLSTPPQPRPLPQTPSSPFPLPGISA